MRFPLLVLTVLLSLAACSFDSSGLTPDDARDAGGTDTARTDLLTADRPTPDLPGTDLLARDLPTPDQPALDLSTPDLPTPDLPTPDLPTPDLPPPDLSTPDLPAPDLPKPDLSIPDLPIPDLPTPDLPIPDLPTPDLPIPDLPIPDLPTPDSPIPDLPLPDSYPQPPASTVYAFPAPSSGITIDGNLAEWTGGWISIAAPADWISSGGSSSGPADISAKFAARWDAAALYLAFEVTDNTHHNTWDSDTSGLWQGDSVQVGLDMAQNGGSNYDATDDFEYGWAVTNSSNQIRHRWIAPTSAPAMANTFVVKRTGTTTFYEVRLPLSDLGISSLSSATSMGFSTIVNENDGSGRDGFIEWTTGVGAGKNPAAFGVLTLMP